MHLYNFCCLIGKNETPEAVLVRNVFLLWLYGTISRVPILEDGHLVLFLAVMCVSVGARTDRRGWGLLNLTYAFKPTHINNAITSTVVSVDLLGVSFGLLLISTYRRPLRLNMSSFHGKYHLRRSKGIAQALFTDSRDGSSCRLLRVRKSGRGMQLCSAVKEKQELFTKLEDACREYKRAPPSEVRLA